MSLTFQPGPLAGGSPDAVNYRIEGPAHRLLFHDFPRRVRALFAGETVLDTVNGKLLHETGLLPVLYVPFADVRDDLLVRTAHTTHCPFKGDASYWSVRAGGRGAENAIWEYPEPLAAASWLRGYVAFYWNAMDEWYDEDERALAGLCDPYHRADVRETSRRVRISVDGETIAETERPLLLSETGLANRLYVPPEAIRRDLLVPSETVTACPYKGEASYWSVRLGDRLLADAAWSYEEPFDGVRKVAGHLSFDHDELTVEEA